MLQECYKHSRNATHRPKPTDCIPCRIQSHVRILAWKGQVVCHRCQTQAVKFGINAQRFQRYHRKLCGKAFAEIPERPLDDLRVAPEKAYQVVHLLAEGPGVRACERLTGLNRRTILGILETTGRKCARLLDAKIR